MACVFLILAPSVAQPGPLRGLNAYVEIALRAWNVPGVSTAIVKDGRVVEEPGYSVLEGVRPGGVDERRVFASGCGSTVLQGLPVHRAEIQTYASGVEGQSFPGFPEDEEAQRGAFQGWLLRGRTCRPSCEA